MGRFVAGQQARYTVVGEGERFLFTRVMPTGETRTYTTFAVVKNWFAEFRNQSTK